MPLGHLNRKVILVDALGGFGVEGDTRNARGADKETGGGVLVEQFSPVPFARWRVAFVYGDVLRDAIGVKRSGRGHAVLGGLVVVVRFAARASARVR